MNAPSFAAPSDVLFRNALAASLALHAGFWLLGVRWTMPGLDSIPAVEIDLTQPPGTGPAKLGAPKRLDPKARGIAKPAPEPVTPEQVAAPAPPAPPPDWVLPGPQTQMIEKPAPPATTPGGALEGTGTAAKVGGSGEGSDEGVPGGTGTGGGGRVLAFPKLLNRDAVLASLKRLYPESERLAGREGRVVVALHIGADGQIRGVDILDSAGAAFDKVASDVSRMMRFTPAQAEHGPVAVKIKMPMEFRLD